MRPLIFIILSIIWMSLIFYLSSLPSTSTGPDTPIFKVISNALHFILFGILSILFLCSIKWKKPISEIRLKTFLMSLSLSIIYAISDEYHQSFSPGRTPLATDVIIDTFGAIIFLNIIYLMKRYAKISNLLSSKRNG